MSQINWYVDEAETALINQIIDRVFMLSLHGINKSERQAWTMDIVACHCNGCPLDLAALLAASDFNFAHDVAGITAHINRTTGELGGCFVPRFAATGGVA